MDNTYNPYQMNGIVSENIFLRNCNLEQNRIILAKDLEIQNLKSKHGSGVKEVAPAFLFHDIASGCIKICYKEGNRISYFSNFGVKSCTRYIYDYSLGKDNKLTFTIEMKNDEKLVTIAESMFNTQNIVKEFQIQVGACFTGSFKNAFISEIFFNYLATYSTNAQEIIILPIGWYYADDGRLFFNTKSETKQIDSTNIIKVQTKSNIAKEMDEFVNTFNVFSTSTNAFLFSLLHNALLRTVLESYDLAIPQVTVLSADDIQLGEIIPSLLQIYSREKKELTALSQGRSVISDKIYYSKDEIKIFLDDLPNKKSKDETVTMIIQAYTQKVPISKSLNGSDVDIKLTPRSNLVLLSNSIPYTYFDSSQMVYLPIERSETDLSKLYDFKSLNARFTYYITKFIHYVEQNSSDICQKIELDKKEYFNRFKKCCYDTASLRTFISLSITIDIVEDFFNSYGISLSTFYCDEKISMQERILEVINHSSQWGDYEGLSQLFKEKVVEIQGKNLINIINGSTGECEGTYDKSKPSLFVKGDYIYISLRSIRMIITEYFPIEVPALHVQKALKFDGWLVCHKNSYETKPILKLPNGETSRMSMMQISKKLFDDLGVESVF